MDGRYWEGEKEWEEKSSKKSGGIYTRRWRTTHRRGLYKITVHNLKGRQVLYVLGNKKEEIVRDLLKSFSEEGVRRISWTRCHSARYAWSMGSAFSTWPRAESNSIFWLKKNRSNVWGSTGSFLGSVQWKIFHDGILAVEMTVGYELIDR